VAWVLSHSASEQGKSLAALVPSSPASVCVCKSRSQWGAAAGRTVHLRCLPTSAPFTAERRKRPAHENTWQQMRRTVQNSAAFVRSCYVCRRVTRRERQTAYSKLLNLIGSRGHVTVDAHNLLELSRRRPWSLEISVSALWINTSPSS
jgi:hypothetical protein